MDYGGGVIGQHYKDLEAYKTLFLHIFIAYYKLVTLHSSFHLILNNPPNIIK